MLPFIEGEDDLGLPQGSGVVAELNPGLKLSRLDLRERKVQGADLSGAWLHQPLMDALTLQESTLDGAHLRHARLDNAKLTGIKGRGLSITMASAEGISLQDCDLQESHWVGVSARDVTFKDVDLRGARLSLCQLFGARWAQVEGQGASLAGVNLSFSTLEDVDLAGADLRGSIFAHSQFKNVNLSGALCDGADFQSVRGLSPEDRAYLQGQGAKLRGSRIERSMATLLSKIVPSLGPEALDRGARSLSLGLQAFGVIIALALTLALFWDRVTPPEGTVSLGDERAPVKETVTSSEEAATQANLAKLRAAIKNAYATAERYGVAAYPSLEDLGDNTFDRDGAGPGEERLTLVEGGLPPNLLTAGEGVLPYCNDTASQETLSGDDSDWHYCPESGAIYACGGYTTLPTLGW